MTSDSTPPSRSGADLRRTSIRRTLHALLALSMVLGSVATVPGVAGAAPGYLKDVELPTYMPKAGSEIATPEHAKAAPQLMEATAAMLRIVSATGQRFGADQYTFFMQRYADGVPEDQIDALIAQYQQSTAPVPEPMRAAGGLRSV